MNIDFIYSNKITYIKCFFETLAQRRPSTNHNALTHGRFVNFFSFHAVIVLVI